MRYFMTLFALTLLCTATPSFADDFRTEITADITGDGLIDFVELYENVNPGDADLRIWVRNTNGVLELSSQSLALVWVGGPGQQAELSLTDHGSLQVISQNYSIGRNRWQQTLTLAYRNDIFVLAGFTYNWYDSLNLEDSGNCDVNLLTGKGVLETGNEVVSKTRFTTNAYHGPIEHWDKEWPKECNDAF